MMNDKLQKFHYFYRIWVLIDHYLGWTQTSNSVFPAMSSNCNAAEFSLWMLGFLFSFFIFKDFIYLFMRDTGRGRDTDRGRSRCLTRSPMRDSIPESRPEPKADVQPLSHARVPGCWISFLSFGRSLGVFLVCISFMARQGFRWNLRSGGSCSLVPPFQHFPPNFQASPPAFAVSPLTPQAGRSAAFYLEWAEPLGKGYKLSNPIPK